MTIDPRRAIEAAALDAAKNGHAQPAPRSLELVLQDCRIDIGDANDQATGAPLKIIIVTHASGGLRVVIPIPPQNARIVGNALCDRPNITLP